MRRSVAALLVCGLAACGGETAPEERVQLDVWILSVRLDSIFYSSRFPSYVCDFELEATVEGPSGHAIQWDSGVPYTRHLDAIARGMIYPPGEWTAAQLVEIWGSSRVEVGETVRSRPIRLAPYHYAFVFRYSDPETGERFAHPGVNSACIPPRP